MGSVDPQTVHALAASAGIGAVRAVAPMAGGANNRVFRVEAEAGAFLLKSYFRHPDDPRDRLGTEFAFSRFAWANGVRCVPQPLASDPAAGLGLFEFVFGRSLQNTVAGEPAVDQAIDFFRTLNHARHDPAAAALPPASEACFSLDDHFGTRLGRTASRQRCGLGCRGRIVLGPDSFIEVRPTSETEAEKRFVLCAAERANPHDYS